jgi:4-amino-4-deoxy-L-arabinose transferase-like glycosyltransferase
MRRPRFGTALGLIAAAGLAARLVYALVVMHDVPVGGDGLEFHILANQLASGDGYIQPLIVSPAHVPTADKPPLYPLLLALPSLLGWKTLVAHRVVSCLMGAALVVGVGLIGRRVGGERVGLLAAAIAGLYPALVVLDGSVRSESLYAPLIAFLLLAAYRLVDRPTVWRAVAVGALIGLAMLTRSEAALLGVLLLVLAARRLPRGSRAWPSATVVVVAVLVVTPWLARNWTQYDRPLLSTNEGSLLYGANCHAAYYSGQIGSWPCYPRLTVTPGRDEAHVSSELRSTGLRYAGDHASRLPAVAAVRVLRTFDLWSPNRATRLEADIGNRDLTIYRIGVAIYYLLAPLAVAGALILRRRREPLGLLLAPLALVVVVSIVGYGTPRFRVPLEIPLVVLAAVALEAVASARGARAARSPAGVPRSGRAA